MSAFTPEDLKTIMLSAADEDTPPPTSTGTSLDQPFADPGLRLPGCARDRHQHSGAVSDGDPGPGDRRDDHGRVTSSTTSTASCANRHDATTREEKPRDQIAQRAGQGPAQPHPRPRRSTRPEHVVSSAELAPRLGLDEAWILKRSGVRNRRFASPGGDPDHDGGGGGREGAGRGRGEPRQNVGCVIVATMFAPDPDALGWPPQVGHVLGAGRAAAFDIIAACAGFPYGRRASPPTWSAPARQATYWPSGAERSTDIVEPTDAGTAFLFADGARRGRGRAF